MGRGGWSLLIKQMMMTMRELGVMFLRFKEDQQYGGGGIEVR